METKVNLVDMNFKDFSDIKTREAFILMDIALKKIHSQGLMVTDFNPKNIYFENGIYFFENISPINVSSVETKEEAVLKNIVELSNLAFCSYLPDYKLENGLLNVDVISDNFSNFSSYFPQEDLNYYKSILVDGYKNKKLPDCVYFTDYIVKQNKENPSKGNTSSMAYIKATEAGRMFANRDEAAFGYKFFFLTVVFSMTVLLIGFIIGFYVYLG